MWIKICGITSTKDAELAMAAGADAIGFVFAESPRRVTPEAAGEISANLRQSVEKIGVFVDASVQEIAAVHAVAGLTGVQLHGSGRVLGIERLGDGAKDNGGPVRVLRVVRYHRDPHRFALELRKLREGATTDGQQNAILVDTWSPGKQGGTGIAFDWLAARDIFLREAPHLRLIAAGGLHPGNIREAIQTLRPWGIDVSSGVEESPGKKSSELLKAFIREARVAEMEVRETARA